MRQRRSRLAAVLGMILAISIGHSARGELLMVTMDADFQKGCTKQMWILARENGKLSVTGGTLFVYRDDIDLVLADTLIFDGGCEGLLTSHKAVLLSRLVPVANPTLVGLSRGQIGLVLPAAEFQDILSQFQPVPIVAAVPPPPPGPPHPPFFEFGGKPPPEQRLAIGDRVRSCHLDDVCINPSEKKICAAVRCEQNGKSVAINLCSSNEHEIKASLGPVELSFKVKAAGEK